MSLLVAVVLAAWLSAEDVVAKIGPGDISAAAAAHPSAADALKLVKVPKGARLDVWAAEPMLANPVGFAFDERGRAYVAETFRYREGGTLDIRYRTDWLSDEFKKRAGPERLHGISDELLDREIASRSVEDRAALNREFTDLAWMKRYAEQVRVLEDRDGDGRADASSVFAEGFNDPLDGVAAAVLPWKGDVFFANIPRLWRLRDRNGDGKADERTPLSSGYGVRYGFTGKICTGCAWGPTAGCTFRSAIAGRTS
jgi:quinoprotein glucose dehydrogenase